MPLIYPLLTGLALQLGGAWWWIGLPFNLLLVPLLDLWLLRRGWVAPRAWVRLSHWRGVLLLLAVADWTCLLAAIHQAAPGIPAWQFFGLASTVGIMTGSSALPAAHDLIHRRSSAERGLGLVFLASASYMHFRVEHVLGHHRQVGTAADPATARIGESFPAFLGRALLDGFRGAWRIESRRLRRYGAVARVCCNRVAHYVLIEALIYLAIYRYAGAAGIGFMALQSFIGIHLLEAVNYIQHFGVSRAAREGPAPIGAALSRDSHSPLAGLFLLGLPKHAQHHIDPRIPGERLGVHPDAALIPVSFYWAVFLAILPGAERRLERWNREAGAE